MSVCASVGPLIRRSVDPLVRRSVGPSIQPYRIIDKIPETELETITVACDSMSHRVGRSFRMSALFEFLGIFKIEKFVQRTD